MNKTAIFILAIFTISMLACVSTKSSSKIKNKKFLNSNKKTLIMAKDDLNNTDTPSNSNLNFTNLYPIVDKSYNEAWKDAENSGENADLNKYYFCQNLTLAKQIHDELHANISLFHGILDEHRETLQNYKNGDLIRVDNSNSSYDKNSSSPEYDEFLGELSRTYQNDYLEKIIKIEKIMEDNKHIALDLSSTCSDYEKMPEKKPEEIKEGEKNISPIDKGEKSTETIGFTELKGKSRNMTRRESLVYNQLVQMHERVRNIINRSSA